MQRGSCARRTLLETHVLQSDLGASQPVVQHRPSSGGQDRICSRRFGTMRTGLDRVGATVAPMRVPRVHFRAGHHHVRVHS